MSLWPQLAGRRILVTGDTGFKGSWLCHWLQMLRADVIGLGLPPSTEPNLFHILQLPQRMRHFDVDIRQADALRDAVREIRPEIIFHLAAQALVRESYLDPKTTFDTNVSGLVNLLEAVRGTRSVQVCMVVTSDKCYENHEWVWGYRESDPLGGYDPYSASKGAAEIVAAAYRRSFFSADHAPRLATARAGNVIGGGDWSPDRLIVDCVRSLAADRPVVLRNPHAVRPWQHVLDPLAGYIHLAVTLLDPSQRKLADSYNFGPDHGDLSVNAIAQALFRQMGRGSVQVESQPPILHEANILRLDCAKARSLLGWRPTWDVQTSVQATAEWYAAWGRTAPSLDDLTTQQIEQFTHDAVQSWAYSLAATDGTPRVRQATPATAA